MKNKAIFLDRDGTINKDVDFLKSAKELELLPGVCEAISKINKRGYLVIIITNQAVIARGDISINQLDIIHDKLKLMLELGGAHIDDIYYCPHYPKQGFPGERIEYKKKCDCRKPQPGLILRAAQDYNIDLEKSWMVGDSKNDVIAGKKVGCHTALLGRNGLDNNGEYKLLIDFVNSVIV